MSLQSSAAIPGTHFCWRLSQLQGHSVFGRIMSMKNSTDTIGNRTRDLPACSCSPSTNSATACPQYPPIQTFENFSRQTPTMKGRNLLVHDRNIIDSKNSLHQKFSMVSYLKQRNNEVNRISDNIHYL
jgi:hypothetical protein